MWSGGFNCSKCSDGLKCPALSQLATWIIPGWNLGYLYCQNQLSGPHSKPLIFRRFPWSWSSHTKNSFDSCCPKSRGRRGIKTNYSDRKKVRIWLFTFVCFATTCYPNKNIGECVSHLQTQHNNYFLRAIQTYSILTLFLASFLAFSLAHFLTFFISACYIFWHSFWWKSDRAVATLPHWHNKTKESPQDSACPMQHVTASLGGMAFSFLGNCSLFACGNLSHELLFLPQIFPLKKKHLTRLCAVLLSPSLTVSSAKCGSFLGPHCLSRKRPDERWYLLYAFFRYYI